MHSIRTKFTLLTVSVIIIALTVETIISVYSVKKLGRSDADQLLHLMCQTGAMNLESYFQSVENSTKTVSDLVQDSFESMPDEDLEAQVERARNLFGRVAFNTNGVLTYYFRIDPQASDTVKGFWYVNLDGEGFKEHEVTDITQYDTNNTSELVWFTVPKATGKGVWLPPYNTDNLGARVISYNVPVYRNGIFIGVIGIEIDYQTLVHEVENIKLFENGYAFVLDEDSNLIYHPCEEDVLSEGENTVIDNDSKRIGDNHIQYQYKGEDKEAVWLPLSNGMRLYVTVPLAEINYRWQEIIWRLLAAALVVLLCASVVMMRFLSRLTKPLIDLTEAARRIDQGDYDIEVEYDGDDEIAVLAHTIQALAAHTKAHISDLNKQVYVDSLTSVRNKGGYLYFVQKMQDQIDKSDEPLEFAIGVFDCDNLKMINDTYGHDKGDEYLKAACRLICKIFKHSPVFRIGGDEFAVIMQNGDYQNRESLVNEFRKTRKEICEAAGNQWDQVNVTMGMAVYDPQGDPSVDDVARRADRIMYENKRLRKEKLAAGSAKMLGAAH